MLFDLRGSGRRTTVKAVYLTLALLMGGGLVLFGIGGDVSGGLVDALNSDGGSLQSGDDRFRDRATEAQRAAEANPKDPEAFAALARARYQYASTGDFVDRANGTYTAAGKAQLAAAAAAWEKHLQLAGDKPDDSVANVMVQVYSQVGLNDPVKAVRAQEIITESRPKDSTFATLAVLAYQAGQTRKGDLATKEALALSDKADRNTLKSELETAKQQALASQIQDATGSATPAPTADGNSGSGGSGGSGGGKKDNQGNTSGD